ncbi:MAG: PaaI family thioesterase [Spirochaetaceae bacterium]|nr:PaaI family thioesterase [Myxococcales bacterium]MCB9724382.1 PaaI family thioesterase [Spirochaetaceae bacterium]HPG26079.1 PaaI family thioesterase [Myxococcota bacterium]
MSEKTARPPLEPHYDPWDIPNPSVWAQKRRLADAMRRVIAHMVLSDAPEEELSAAADALERYADRLASHPKLERVMGHAEAANAGNVAAFFDQSPLIGLANPLAPPLLIGRTGERTAAATGTFGYAYEGPPGHVHGGFVAAAFDEVLGYVQSLGGNPGMTGRLTVHYRKPTPLHVELRFEAELVRVEGRKIFTTCQLFAGDDLKAEAEGLFVSIPPERLRGLAQERATPR